MNDYQPSPINRFDADHNWNKARRKVLYNDVVCLIKGCSVDLLSFSEVSKQLQLHQKSYRGLQTVPLEKIRGSVGRFDDFNSAFLPRKDFLKDRWKNVQLAMLEGKTPPVDLYQVGDDYYVLDGNHRVSVARAREMDAIDAYVTEFTGPMLQVETNVDNLFIESERGAFLEKIGRPYEEKAGTIEFTSPGCYADLTKQIEEYRQGKEKQNNEPYSFSQAFNDWHEEIYAPAIDSIRQNEVTSHFPDRTEADLFIWSYRNSAELEDLEFSDDLD
jgi:hypothetical protein